MVVPENKNKNKRKRQYDIVCTTRVYLYLLLPGISYSSLISNSTRDNIYLLFIYIEIVNRIDL